MWEEEKGSWRQLWYSWKKRNDMFEKTDEVKVLRDPVHGYIHVEYKVIWDIINSSWFQRLRRIRQLGGAYMVYHCAEHTRFAHSLGVYEIVRRMVNEIEGLKENLNEREKMVVMLAGLLHDVGHGPFSHAFESVTNTSHEIFTCRIIEEHTEITDILENAAEGLSKEVADVIRHTSENPLMSQLISSQLDADRMDYLLRDAYFTGTKYGEFDIERILRTLRVQEGRLVVKQSGVYAVENYIMARYHMYWQIYYHPVARSYEFMLHAIFRRLKDLGNTGYPAVDALLQPILTRKKISLSSYFKLDENTCSYAFEVLTEHEDPVVKDLAQRIRDRNLFEYADRDDPDNQMRRKELRRKGYDLKYYWGMDSVQQNPYIPYTDESSETISVQMKNGTLRDLSNASNIVYSLIHGPMLDDEKVFFPCVSE